MATTAGTRPKTKPAPAKVVHLGTDQQGYSYLLMSQGTGQKREFWWMCGACWSDTTEEPLLDQGIVVGELTTHLMVCPGAPYQAQIQIVWADGHPPTNVRI